MYPVCIIGVLRNQENMKTPENLKVSKEAEGYRCVQIAGRKQVQAVTLIFTEKSLV